MSCQRYSAEDMIAFVMDPLQENHCRIAAHILHCPDCQQEHLLALAAVMMDQIPAEAQDLQSAQAAVSACKANININQRFADFLQRLDNACCKMLHGASCGMTDIYEWLNGAAAGNTPQACAVFGAPQTAASRIRPAENHTAPKITFESCCGVESCYYWKMELVLPLLVNNLARATVRLYKQDKAMLNRCTLCFLGNKLQIIGGSTSIPLKMFSENARNNTVEVLFSDGTVSPGMIRFLPEKF